MRVRVVGIHKVRKRLADGSVREYYYAWRGGPRIDAQPNSRAFLTEYTRLTQGRDDAIRTNTLAEIVIAFQNSEEFRKLKPRTQSDYADHIGHILAAFADLPIPALEERGMRKVFTDWRDSMAATPRRADMRISALSRMLNYAIDQEIIAVNKAQGIGKLSDGTRRDVIWTPEQLDRFIGNAPQCLSEAVQLALWTGQRQGDLLALTWNAWDGRIISLRQAKGGKRVRIVANEPLKAMLDAMPRKAVTILTNGRGLPWGSGFGGYFRKWQNRLGVTGVTFHDLRGTFITNAYEEGYSIKQISEASGHSERDADRIIRDHYLAADLTMGVNEYRTKM